MLMSIALWVAEKESSYYKNCLKTNYALQYDTQVNI